MGGRFCLPTKGSEQKLIEKTVIQTREIKNQQHASTGPAFPGLYNPGSKSEKTGRQNPKERQIVKKIKINSLISS